MESRLEHFPETRSLVSRPDKQNKNKYETERKTQLRINSWDNWLENIWFHSTTGTAFEGEQKAKLVYSTPTLNQSTRRVSVKIFLLRSSTPLSSFAFCSRRALFENTENSSDFSVSCLSFNSNNLFYTRVVGRWIYVAARYTQSAPLHLSVLEIISTMPMLSHHCERLLIENCPKIIHIFCVPPPPSKDYELWNLFS